MKSNNIKTNVAAESENSLHNAERIHGDDGAGKPR
jgi:hypothetical protein